MHPFQIFVDLRSQSTVFIDRGHAAPNDICWG